MMVFPLSYPYGQRQPEPPLPAHPYEDNPHAFTSDIGGPSTCPEPLAEANASPWTPD